MPISNNPITQATPLTALLSNAQSEVKNLLTGEEFIVRDLFLGYEWKRIDKGNRTRLGSLFFAFAQSEGLAELAILGKTPQNQQIYRKR